MRQRPPMSAGALCLLLRITLDHGRGGTNRPTPLLCFTISCCWLARTSERSRSSRMLRSGGLYGTISIPRYDADLFPQPSPQCVRRRHWNNLVAGVNSHVAALGRPEFSLTLSEVSQRPQLEIARSLGFLRVVWIEVVRILTGT